MFHGTTSASTRSLRSHHPRLLECTIAKPGWRRVHARGTTASIFVVDDLDAFWQRLAPQTDTLVAPESLPSGRRFIVRHADGRVVEYLQLAAVAA